MRSKDWRCRARFAPAKSPWRALVACVPRLRQRQSFLHTLFAKSAIKHSFSTPMLCVAQAVELVVRDEDVLASVQLFSINVCCFRLSAPEQGIFSVLDGDVGAQDVAVVAVARFKQKSSSQGALASELLEAMVLLEAVAVSHRLAALIVEAGGVVELVRGIATLAYVKGLETNAKAGGAASRFKAVARSVMEATGASGKAITEALQVRKLCDHARMRDFTQHRYLFYNVS